MTEIALFSTSEFRLEITPHDVDGFRVQAPGLARALSVADAHTLLRGVPDAEKGSALVRTPGGEQRVSFVTEAGFYRALGQRQLGRIVDTETRERVERFQNWVYREVIPTIRRTGGYSNSPALMPALPQNYAEALRELAAKVEDNERLTGQVAELAPAAESWNTLATAAGDLAVADAAKLLSRDPAIKIGRDRLFTVLRDLEWVYRQRVDQRHRAYQSAIDAGRLMELPSSHYHPRTGELVLDPPQVRVTVKGLEWLHKHLRTSQDVVVRGGAA